MDSQRFFPRFIVPLSRKPRAAGMRLPLPRLLPSDLGHATGVNEPGTLGRLGHMEVRLATSAAEIKLAQKLRYHVFYEEMSAVANSRTSRAKRDADRFDAICDHLLVIDHGLPRSHLHQKLHDRFLSPPPAIVGTYRLLRQNVAERNGGFYTADEYDIAPLINANPRLSFLELGRSCVLAPYRDKRTVELLWHGIWAYVLSHGIDVMLGCASLPGTDPDALAMPLSFLHHHAKAPAEWCARAVNNRYVAMNRLPADQIDTKAALRALPPLIKGYLRLGGFVGDGAVIDHEFGTVDVLIVLPVSNINPRYVAYYGADAGRYAS